MGEDSASLEEAYESLARTLRVKQEFQRVLIDGIGTLPDERLHAFAERLVREVQSWRSGARWKSLPAVESVPDVIATAGALARESWDDEGDHGELMRSAAMKLAALRTAAGVLLAERNLLRWLHAESAFELARERSSRQAWAEEALKWTYYARMGRDVEHLVAFGKDHDRLPRACACVTDEQAAQLGPSLSRPVCAVHPE
jgi:hypothetical protein